MLHHLARHCLYAPLRLLGMALLLWGMEAVAADPEQDYAQGVEAFDKGQYEQALGFLLDARAGGMDEPALDYNLGAAYFRLGRYAEAKKAFSATARDADLAPLAYYNLGLCSIQLGEERTARGWFERVLRTTDNPRLRTLAVEQLKDSTEPPEAKTGVGFLSAGLGYDTNVLLLSDRDILQNSRREDAFLDLSAYGSHPLAGNPEDIVFNIDGSANLLAYRSLSDYDISDFRVGGTADATGDWSREAGVHFDYAFVGGQDFTRELLFALATSHDFSPNGRLRLQYEYGLVDAVDADYRYLDGRRQRVDARLILRRDDKALDLGYEFEFNDRRDLQTPLFSSYSPIRNGLRLIAKLPLAGKLDLEAETRYLYSFYRDTNEVDDGVFQRRRDGRVNAALRLIYSLDDDTELSLEYLYLQNRSNIDRYDYIQNLMTLSVSRLFQ